MTGLYFYYRVPWAHNSTLHNCTQLQADNNFSSAFTESCQILNEDTRAYREQCLEDRYTSVTTMFDTANITNDVDNLDRRFYTHANTSALVAFDACLQSGSYDTLSSFNATVDSVWGFMTATESRCAVQNKTTCMQQEAVEYQLLLLYLQHFAMTAALDVNYTIDDLYTFTVREPTAIHAVAMVPATTSNSSKDNTILYISLGVAGGTIVLGLTVWIVVRRHPHTKSSTSLYEFL